MTAITDREAAVRCSRCGHSRGAHDHWRAGNDCGVCAACPGYVPALAGRLRDAWASLKAACHPLPPKDRSGGRRRRHAAR